MVSYIKHPLDGRVLEARDCHVRERIRGSNLMHFIDMISYVCTLCILNLFDTCSAEHKCNTKGVSSCSDFVALIMFGIRIAAMGAAFTLNLILWTSTCSKNFIVVTVTAKGIKTPSQIIVKEEQILYRVVDMYP
jgi:hypothetical protein